MRWSIFITSTVPGKSQMNGDHGVKGIIHVIGHIKTSKCRIQRLKWEMEMVLRLTCQWFCCFDRIMYALLQAPTANQRLKKAAVCSLTVAAIHNPTHSCVKSARKQLCLSFFTLIPLTR